MKKQIVIDLHFLTPYALNMVETRNQKSIWESCSSKNGKSAYEIALDNGFVGTESEWLLSLSGDGSAQIVGDVANYNPLTQIDAIYQG